MEHNTSGLTKDDSSIIGAFVTVPNHEVAQSLASSLVASHLAACVNIIPGIESVYFWEGKVQRDSEMLLMIKTQRRLLDDLTAHVKANHPYSVPEVIAVPVIGGHAPYLEWVRASTSNVSSSASTTSTAAASTEGTTQ